MELTFLHKKHVCNLDKLHQSLKILVLNNTRVTLLSGCLVVGA